MIKLIIAVGIVLVLIYLLFLSDTRLSPHEQRGYQLLVYLFTRRIVAPAEGDEGKPWGIWVLIIGVLMILFGLWRQL